MYTIKHIQWYCFYIEVTELIQNIRNKKISFANKKNTVKRKKMEPNKNKKNLFKLFCDLAHETFIGKYPRLSFSSSSFARNMKFPALDKSYTKFIFIGLL